MKHVLVDSSSAILLFKSGWLEPLVDYYLLKTGWAAHRELTIPGYPGADLFRQLFEQGKINILPSGTVATIHGDSALNAMGAGESECIRHFLNGAGDFILVDDGRAAAYCRVRQIPYVNALLVPRILALVNEEITYQEIADAMARIYALGRYAPWVWDHARRCGDAALAAFRP